MTAHMDLNLNQIRRMLQAKISGKKTAYSCSFESNYARDTQ